jgi:hypothetical protein
MRPITELIDVMHDVEDGTSVVVETDGERYRGVVTRSAHDTSDGANRTAVRVEIRRTDGDDPELLELRTAASASQKFPRPKLYAGGFETAAEDESLGAVADLAVDESDI